MDTALFLPLFGLFFLVMAVALVFLAYSYRKLVEEFDHVRNHTTREHSTALNKASKIVSSAREESQHLIAESEEKAQDIIVNAEFFTAETQKDLSEKLETATRKHLTAYNQMLETFRDDLKKTFTAMAKDLELGATTELESFRKVIQDQTKKAESLFDEQAKANLAQADAAAKAYEDLIKQQLDEKARAAVKEVVEKVIPQLPSNQDQEALVLKALTEAKEHHAI